MRLCRRRAADVGQYARHEPEEWREWELIIGVPKEQKSGENRVSMTAATVREAVARGHTVLVQRGAGAGSGIADEDYAAAGAELVDNLETVYERAEMVVKVKEPEPFEWPLLRSDHILFTYLHLAASKELTEAIVRSGAVGIAYETVQLANGALPLLTPMSEIAGRMTVQVGARFLEKFHGGAGVLLGGVPGVPPANVVVVGAGTVGFGAALVGLGMGARVTLIDNSLPRLRYLHDVLHGRYVTLMSNAQNIADAVAEADLLIGAVLVPGAKAPKLVTDAMVRAMKPGSVIIDVAVDQGGCIETVDRTTTHASPVYERYGVLHYAVPNMPGAVPRTATLALTNATQPYVLKVADLGWREAARQDPALALGVNCAAGKLTSRAVAEAHGMEYTPLDQVLAG